MVPFQKVAAYAIAHFYFDSLTISHLPADKHTSLWAAQNVLRCFLGETRLFLDSSVWGLHMNSKETQMYPLIQGCHTKMLVCADLIHVPQNVLRDVLQTAKRHWHWSLYVFCSSAVVHGLGKTFVFSYFCSLLHNTVYEVPNQPDIIWLMKKSAQKPLMLKCVSLSWCSILWRFTKPNTSV